MPGSSSPWRSRSGSLIRRDQRELIACDLAPRSQLEACHAQGWHVSKRQDRSAALLLIARSRRQATYWQDPARRRSESEAISERRGDGGSGAAAKQLILGAPLIEQGLGLLHSHDGQTARIEQPGLDQHGGVVPVDVLVADLVALEANHDDDRPSPSRRGLP